MSPQQFVDEVLALQLPLPAPTLQVLLSNPTTVQKQYTKAKLQEFIVIKKKSGNKDELVARIAQHLKYLVHVAKDPDNLPP
jgi:hypothetical protein